MNKINRKRFLTNKIPLADKLSHLKPSNKIILLFAVMIFLPTVILISFNYYSSIETIQNEVLYTKFLALEQLEINISSHLDRVKDISDMLFVNTTMQKILSETSPEIKIEEQLVEMRELGKLINIAQDNNDIYKARLFLNSNKIYSREHIDYFPMESIKNWVWYEEILNKKGSLYFKSTYLEKYLFNKSSYVVSCARVLWDPDDFRRMIGILVLDIEESSLYEMINNVEFAKQENIFIIDLDGYIVSNSNKALLGKPLFSEKERTEILASKEDILTFGSGKNTKFILHKTISSNGWRIIVEIPSSDILKNYKSYNNMISYILTITVIVIFVFTVFIIAAIMVERLTLRVKNLTQVIETVGIDNYGQNANFYGYIDRLEYSIHNMLDTVKRLVEESYQAKVHEKEAQLYALQAQINPHFLYNTLDTINWMAIKQGTNDISILVDSLAKYFRLVLSKGKDIVTIQEEINLIKVYLDIQRARFGDKYIVEYNISNEVNEYSIPKFTLQPIIENALEHGIQKKKDRRGTINIQAEKKDSDIQFIISDNGIGIQQEYLEKILDPPTGAINKGYGLYNVHQRLILFSDNNKAYGLKISSKENVGTTVVITLKAAK